MWTKIDKHQFANLVDVSVRSERTKKRSYIGIIETTSTHGYAFASIASGTHQFIQQRLLSSQSHAKTRSVRVAGGRSRRFFSFLVLSRRRRQRKRKPWMMMRTFHPRFSLLSLPFPTTNQILSAPRLDGDSRREQQDTNARASFS